ncbi:putative UPF0481 protein [Cucumis melo var. makuwa]|uniref:UPF0481 protein At3g02645 n=2 Tax=Cucumis melo TaxID=3656 RepID=A0A1S3CDL4_CUCME|nr:putative UPF0481 protein At3g02645 [Cucumis melo]XP_008461156.2 putative UPF0481 protein At3g02645 [Cucumis melo]XP_050944624.1 putative UPF0481 protein At3g02645 [Cucumis melo]XP_050944629.1 putative UPF0481 protein At3g02645 [Cucumis melo]XP_050944631.1 putative UPF0481 protein At3g02645 [Cucumis melo]KAA0058728.1 putative UPF0481 protein [Cucumis melo var. makuwa]
MSFSSKSRLHSLPAGNSWGLNSGFDEERWVIQIRQSLDEEELEEDIGIPVCIFNVPKSLMVIDPDSYTPQEVAIGPYHHWRQELYEMERYKIAAAKRAQKQLQSLKFHDLVEKLTKHEQKTRACYHKYLNFNSETFAWMMAVDASFLLEVLRVYTREETSISSVSSKLSYLVDYEGRKSAHNAILRDIVMLENQIPLFVLRMMLELQFSAVEPADQLLLSMLLGLYEDLSPFKVMEDLVELQVSVSECFHLLDFLYRMITPKLVDTLETMEDDQNQQEPAIEIVESTFKHPCSPLSSLGSEIWKILSKLNEGPVHFFKRIVGSRPLQVIFKLPWTIVSNIPGIGTLMKPLEYIFSLRKVEEEKDPEKGGSSRKDGKTKLPLLEEITIPSVSELTKSGVRFLPINGGVSAIAFDSKAVIFNLPIIKLDVNSEVVLRNLVAYEASKSSGPLVFTRFIELMNGIIDSEEDVKLLKEKGIILNHLKSDAEVAEVWNGMSKSIKLTKVPFLDKVIEDVNKHYSSRWKVKAAKFVEKYVFGSWPLLALLATILLLAMNALQAFCSVYSCSRFFDHLSTAGT